MSQQVFIYIDDFTLKRAIKRIDQALVTASQKLKGLQRITNVFEGKQEFLMPRLNFISRFQLDEIKHKHALKKCQGEDDTLEKALDKYVENKTTLDDLRHIFRLRHLVTQMPSTSLSTSALEQD